MKDVTATKTKLEQKKARLAAEEVKFKIKERKARTRLLIELGGLVVKAELESLPSNTLYGALLSLKDQMQTNNQNIIDNWTKVGRSVFDKEEKDKQTIILTFEAEPTKELTSKIRNLGLKWNFVRKEWYGCVTDMDLLKETLKEQSHKIDVIQ
jgi:hypothetical protein